MEAMGKIAEDMEDAAKRYNSKMLYCHAKNSKGIVNLDLTQ